MSTTDLFVDLMVIGIGAAIWLILLIFSIFGYEWVPVDQGFPVCPDSGGCRGIRVGHRRGSDHRYDL